MFGLFGIGDKQRPTRREEYDGYEYKGGPDSTDSLTIGGKPWNYRDPANFNDGNDRASEKPTYNRDAYEMTNPLYEYSYGQVRDAAKSLGYQNVDEKKEVDNLLNHMQNSSTATEMAPVQEEVTDKQPKKNKKAEPNKPFVMSDSMASNLAYTKAREKRPGSDGYGTDVFNRFVAKYRTPGKNNLNKLLGSNKKNYWDVT